MTGCAARAFARHGRGSTARSTADEVARFAKLAGEWWDANGPFKPLHRINPVRLTYIRDQLCRRFGRDTKAARSLAGLACSISAAAAGWSPSRCPGSAPRSPASTPAEENIAAAKAHAKGARTRHRLSRRDRGGRWRAEGAAFDAVLLLEVVEHVPDVPLFLKAVAPLVKPGGVMILSTLNRTLKAYALAIVGAELILRWLPAGTHQWDRFVTPEELRAALTERGLTSADMTGMVYHPLADEWRLSRDTDVNYFATAEATPRGRTERSTGQ